MKRHLPPILTSLIVTSLVLMVIIVSASSREQHVFGQVFQIASSSESAVPPDVEWQKYFEFGDYALFVKETSAGGYTIVGGGNMKSGNPKRPIFKLDSSGNIQWNKNFTASVPSGWLSISEGDYALVASEGEGSNVTLIDLNGDVVWTETYPSGIISAMVHTDDGGYAMASNVEKGYADVSPWSVNDVMLIKTDSFGEIHWDRVYEFSKDNLFIYSVGSLIQTSDGGYALAGVASSERTGKEFLLVKVDSAGKLQWTKMFGGLNDDETNSLVQTDDGGYLLAGNTHSFGAGGSDVWLVKVDSLGNIVWTRIYGGVGTLTEWNSIQLEVPSSSDGTGSDTLNYLIRTRDGGFAFVGSTPCSTTLFHFDFVWLVKTDSSGNIQWNQVYSNFAGYSDQIKTYGGNSFIEARDGSFVIVGYAHVQGFPWLGNYYVIKTEPAPQLPSTSPPPTFSGLEFPSTTINESGTVDPPSAPIQRKGNVYTITGDLKGTLRVKRDNIVIDGRGYSLQGNGTSGELFIRETQTGINLTDRTNVTINNLQLYRYKDAIHIDGSTNTTISGNNIAENGYGIFQTASTFTTISENNITKNEAGIFVNTLSSNNNITLNNVVKNHGTGIVLNYTMGNVIFGNNISYNERGGSGGLSDSFGSNNLIAGNIFYSNFYSIFMERSTDSIIAGNNITRCSFGIDARDASGNLFYMNNLNNTNGNQVQGEGSNSWDNGTIGNYWNAYNGTDSDGDGIGDTPYVTTYLESGMFGTRIHQNTKNIDNHPFIAPISDATMSALAKDLVLAHSWSSTSTASPDDQSLFLFASLALAIIAIILVAVMIFKRNKSGKPQSY